MEWEVSEPIPVVRHDLEVWLDDGSIRIVRWCFGWLVFQDCLHPLQNMLCDASRVRGWRIEGESDYVER